MYQRCGWKWFSGGTMWERRTATSGLAQRTPSSPRWSDKIIIISITIAIAHHHHDDHPLHDVNLGGFPTLALSPSQLIVCLSLFTASSKWGIITIITQLYGLYHHDHHHHHLSTTRARTGILAGNHNSRVESSANGDIISISISIIVTIIITRPKFWELITLWQIYRQTDR